MGVYKQIHISLTSLAFLAAFKLLTSIEREPGFSAHRGT